MKYIGVSTPAWTIQVKQNSSKISDQKLPFFDVHLPQTTRKGHVIHSYSRKTLDHFSQPNFNEENIPETQDRERDKAPLKQRNRPLKEALLNRSAP